MPTRTADAGDSSVVVVVDYHCQLPPAVEVAIALAHGRRLALRGLLVEDPVLAAVSSLPFCQEITVAGARARALEAKRLDRTLKAFNQRFRQLLSQGAEKAALQYSIDSIEDRRHAMQMGGEPGTDYIVLGQPGLLRYPDREVFRVLLVQARMETALPVLESLQSMSAGRRLELILVDGDDPENEERLQAFAAGRRDVTCHHMAAGHLAGIFRRAGRAPDLVITSRHCNPALLQALTKLAACPVILSA